MSAVLFTGFPGFLGSSLLPRTLRRDPDTRAVALVQQRRLGRAREALGEIERDDPPIAGRTDLVVGDITTPGLGLDGAAPATSRDATTASSSRTTSSSARGSRTTTTTPAAFGIDHVPGVGRLFTVPSSTLEYLTHPTRYDTTATTALLAEVGVACPSFAGHVGPMVEFFRAHPDIGSAAMVRPGTSRLAPCLGAGHGSH